MHVFLVHSNEVFAKKLHRNNHAKNGALVQTTGGKDEPNIVINAEILANNN
jgi:hypothetical protein